MKYQVKLIYKYSDTIDVEADSEEEAIEKAQSSPDHQDLRVRYTRLLPKDYLLKYKRDVTVTRLEEG